VSCSQGRGEFVRLALEEAGADYVNVARGAGGERAMLRLLDGEEVEHPPLAPPYLRAGRLLIGQTRQHPPPSRGRATTWPRRRGPGGPGPISPQPRFHEHPCDRIRLGGGRFRPLTPAIVGRE
jgi:hypothetical protein